MGRVRVFGGFAVGFMIGSLIVTIMGNNELAIHGALLAIASAILAHLE